MDVERAEIKAMLEKIKASVERVLSLDIKSNYMQFQKELTKIRTLVDILETVTISQDENEDNQTTSHFGIPSEETIKPRDVAEALRISQNEANTGTVRTIVRNGKYLNIMIPPGTKSDEVIRLSGQRLITDNLPGDILVTIKVADNDEFLQPAEIGKKEQPTGDIEAKTCPVCGQQTLITWGVAPLRVGCADKHCSNYYGSL